MNQPNISQQMPTNMAQGLLLLFGVPETKVFFGHKLGRSESPTKKGPGRKHKQGRKTNQD